MTDSGPMFSGITTFVDNSGFTFGVGGGTSIFTPATNVLTFGTNNTEKVRIDANGNANITGVTTAANFKTGVSNLHDVGLTLSGGQIDVGSNIKIGTAGVVTATSFVGDGSNLTGITQTTINNNATTKFITGTNNANELDCEANLSYNNSLVTFSSSSLMVDKGSNATVSVKETAGNKEVQLRANTTGGLLRTLGSYPLALGTNQTERLRIDSDGRLIQRYSSTPYVNRAATFQSPAGQGQTYVAIVNTETNGSCGILFGDHAGQNAGNYDGYINYSHQYQILQLMVGSGTERLRLDNNGRLGLSHDLSGTADYNRLMLHNPNSGSCWLQMTSTATGTGANTDGLSIGLNTSNIAHFWLRENAEMQFATNNSLRWRITSSGDVYPQGNYKIGLNSNTAFRMDEVNSNKFVHRYGNSGSATNNQQEAIWYGGGITVMHDNQTLQTTNYTWGLTGNRGYPLLRVRNGNSGGGAIYSESGGITSGSDYRMKENIEEITNGIETVKKLKPSKYNIRKSFNPEDDGTKHHGFIAHEVQEAIPDIGNIVTGTKDAMEEVFYHDDDENIPEGKKAGDSTGTFTDNPDMQGIDYGHMTPILAAAIKELITKVETLEQDNIALRARVTNLEGN
jgi:hypothetical protein